MAVRLDQLRRLLVHRLPPEHPQLLLELALDPLPDLARDVLDQLKLGSASRLALPILFVPVRLQLSAPFRR